MTPKGHFVSLTRQLGKFDRARDYDGLSAYVQTEGFIRSMAAISPEQRRTVMARYAEIHERYAPPPPPKSSLSKPIKWDAAAIAKFLHAYAQGGLETAARVMGITRDAARLAAKARIATATKNAA